MERWAPEVAYLDEKCWTIETLFQVKKPGKDLRKRIKLAAQVNPSVSDPVPEDPVPGPSSVVSREKAKSWVKKTGRLLSYDKIIEGEDAVAFPDELGLDFRFKIPKEVKSIELV